MAGDRLQTVLDKLTGTKIIGVLMGVAITAVIQSSSATTVMVVGFVNSRLISLAQAVNVIMGANIGTTVTGLIIALDIGLIAPAITFLGFILSLQRKSKLKYIGRTLLGFGLLFMGMTMMSTSMAPLRESTKFLSFIGSLDSPVLAILVGALVTAILQSSSGALGILQTLARQGLIPFYISFYVVLGQNIGTCITAVLASIGGSKNAKRAALSHVLFNVIGTVIFSFLAQVLPLFEWFISMAPNAPAAQIAFMHAIFNITITVILLPFAEKLAALSTRLIKGEDEEKIERRLHFLDSQQKNPKFYQTPVIILNARREINRLIGLTRRSVNRSIKLSYDFDPKEADRCLEDIESIRYILHEVEKVLVKVMNRQLRKAQLQNLTNDLVIISNIDRLTDYSQKVVEMSIDNEGDENKFSDYAKEEIKEVMSLVDSYFQVIEDRDKYPNLNVPAEKIYNKLVNALYTDRNNHMNRISEGICKAETGMEYSFLLMALDRMGEHMKEVLEYIHYNAALFGTANIQALETEEIVS